MASEPSETYEISHMRLNTTEALAFFEDSVADLDHGPASSIASSSKSWESSCPKYATRQLFSSVSRFQKTTEISMQPFSIGYSKESPAPRTLPRIASSESFVSVVSHLRHDLDNADIASIGSGGWFGSDMEVSQDGSEFGFRAPTTPVTPVAMISPIGQSLIAETKKRKLSKKGCNCGKSQCIKMYCTCFARGKFCLDCGCKNCHNNLEHSVERGNAIRQALGKNVNAFKPKIVEIEGTPPPSDDDNDAFITPKVSSERAHKKGCRCTRSNCLKRYCECFDANIGCTSKCRCNSCDNTEAKRNEVFAKFALDSNPEENQSVFESGEEIPAWLYLKDNVVEAFTQVLCSKAHEMEQAESEDIEIVKALLYEFGNCLGMILNES